MKTFNNLFNFHFVLNVIVSAYLTGKIGLPLMVISLLMQKHVERFQPTIIICFYVCDGAYCF